MAKRSRLAPDDIQGAWPIIPTPAKKGAEDWQATDTVDLDETARAVDGLIVAGVDGILSLGTLGECATLTWEEKKAFMATVVDAAAGRVPVFVGTTTLNTRDTIRDTKAAQDLGADGTMLGIPMWCAPSVDVAVRFYQDVADALPDMAICIYANPEAFKFDFPRPFWAQVAKIPQVITTKYIGIANLLLDLKLTRGQMSLMPIDIDYYAAARMAPEEVKAFWTTGAVCGPSVAIRLRDSVAKAKKSGDWNAARQVYDDMAPGFAPLFPHGSFKEFSRYNIGLEKERMNAGGWMKAGPIRPPYHLVPEEFLEGARQSGRLWAELHRKYESENTASAAE